MIKVLFVCLGNVCRSPMAEAVFRKMVADAGYENEISTDSCGTNSYHAGEPPHRGTINILNKNRISYEGIYSSKLKPRHFNEFDYIIAMDEENLADINSLKSENIKSKINLLSDYAGGSWRTVPDPYYTGNFDLTYKLVTEGCGGLLKYIIDSFGIK